jgi:outer membrane protein
MNLKINNMKKIIITLIASIFVISGFAQKFAFVDTDYILTNIPTYESAQEQLDQYSIDWQQEIEVIYSEIDKLYKEYQAEKVLLSEEMKVKRENDIINKEKEAKELQKGYFGKNGELYKKRQD